MPLAGAEAAESWLDASILQSYEELGALSRADAASLVTPAWSDHREILTWVVRKLEHLRLKLLRQEVSPQEICSARPLVDDTLQSLRTTHHLGQDEAAFINYLVAEDVGDLDFGGPSDDEG